MKNFKITALSIASLCFIAEIKAQESGSSPVQAPAQNNEQISQPIQNQESNPNPNPNPNPNLSQSQEKTRAFDNQAITFYYGSGNDFSQRQISASLNEQLKYDFPNKKANTIVPPRMVGYQWHQKKNISIGLVYCTSEVTTPNLEYPDLQNPGESTIFNYQVKLNTFMGSFDYHWYRKNGVKHSLTLHSGLALGVYNVNFKTRKVDGNGQNLPEYNLSEGGNGWQINLIGIKQTFTYKILKNFGYMANLGFGSNVIGLSFAATYTL